MPAEAYFPLITGDQLWPIALSAISIVALALSDFTESRPGRYIFKPLAAIAFIWLALSLDAPGSPFGSWMLAGLLFCLIGDVFLMFESDRSFIAGLAAFLIGHLLYCIAFLQLSPNPDALMYSALPVALLVYFTLRWLKPFLPAHMKGAVWLYVLVIAAMLLCASMTAGDAKMPLVLCGAIGFAISDLAVARRQFVNPGRINALWGTPLYFFSQMLLALSIGVH